MKTKETDYSFSFSYGDFSGYLADLEKKHYLANFLLQDPNLHKSFVDVSNIQRASLSRCLGDMTLENIKVLFSNYRQFEEILEASVLDPELKKDFEDWHIERWGGFLKLLNGILDTINQLEHITGIDVAEYRNEITYLLGKERELTHDLIAYSKKADASLLEFHGKFNIK